MRKIFRSNHIIPGKTLKKYSDLSETVGNALGFDENQDIALIRKALESSDYLESP